MDGVETIAGNAAVGAGFIAAAIAIGGFIAHAGPALAGRDDQALRFATVVGGLAGLTVATIITIVSVLVG